MKKFISLIMAVILTFSMVCVVSAETITANPTTSKVIIDGVEQSFEAYNINDNNYFKLRDIAYCLSQTDKRFAIDWQADTNTAILETNKEYVSVGGELAVSSNFVSKNALVSNTNILLNGATVQAKAYLIDGNNYFKLRDLGQILDFSIEWESSQNAIIIDTNASYQIETSNNNFVSKQTEFFTTQIDTVSYCSRDSKIQQFNYMDEGIAYAYVDKETLNVVLPTHELTINLLYPKFADIIADNSGNIYIVWGKDATTTTYDEETVFISKYTSSGILVKTVGFVGESCMGNTGNTKIPFRSANTKSIITPTRMLYVFYSREMYNGHQSNNIVGLNIDSMQPFDYNRRYEEVGIFPYVSHSFGNDIIWSNVANNVVAISHGDGSPRGFIFTTPGSADYIFNFYLQANANGDMSIVNKTFAQMGGIIETSKGFVFVGASAKTLGEEAKNEVQNLFVQVINKDVVNLKERDETYPRDIFIGGTDRTGFTSFNIRDNNNRPLSEITNYGVTWLTNYNDNSVVSPQVVEVNDKVVILWNYKNNNYYMVISNIGEILIPQTSINVPLNSAEQPIYVNGKVQWVYLENGKTGLGSIDIY